MTCTRPVPPAKGLVPCVVAALCAAPSLAAPHCDTAIADGQFGRIDICASSVLTAQSGSTYGPGNMMDDNPATAWVEGVAGVGIGEWVEIRFAGPMRFQTLFIQSGYAKSAHLHERNARPNRLRIFADGDFVQSAQLADSIGMQAVVLSEPVEASRLRVEVVTAIEGSKWPDLAISEFHVDLEELNYETD